MAGSRSRIAVEIEGLDRVNAKLKDPLLVGKPLRHLYERVGIAAKRELVAQTPRFTGRLAGGWADIRISPDPIPLKSGIRNEVFYGRFVDAGTAARSKRLPPSSRSAYAGNPSDWAAAKGIPFWLLQRAITRKGTQAQRILKKGLRKARQDMASELEVSAREIERIWSEGYLG